MKGSIGGGREADAAFDEEAFVQLYRERFAEFHMAWTIFFLQHMSALHRQFGDLEDALLLAAVGIGPVVEKLKTFQATQDSFGLSYGAPVGDLPVTNAVRLSELTGIPRQTVRRKLKAFADRGWLEQTPDRSWRMAQRTDQSVNVSRDLDGVNLQSVKELAQLLGRFDRLMRAHGQK